ncbi:MAG: cell division protein FtsQ/DivIB [Xanthobacteraceae bacterium]
MRANRRRRRNLRRIVESAASYTTAAIGRLLHRLLTPLIDLRMPRGLGPATATLLILASAVYGTVQGGHLPAMLERLADMRNAAANTIGFRIAAITLAGQKQLSREDILASAGITGRSSLLFLDAETTRQRLKTNPWVAEATVLKLFPDQLQIRVTERQAFAVWQKDRRLFVIADDGTVLEPYVAQRFTNLPLVVGVGAESRAKGFLALIGRYPELRDKISASILVAERRWNLRLKNGIDVRLPETGVERALDKLVELDHENKLLSRDVTVIDLRLPDRVTVRLSEAAAREREEALKAQAAKRKGGSA